MGTSLNEGSLGLRFGGIDKNHNQIIYGEFRLQDLIGQFT